MSVTVATVNVNGIRAAVKQRSGDNLGMLPWLRETPASIVLLQEVRATPEQTEKALAPALDDGWHLVQAEAAAKGRAGVAILARESITDVQVGFSDAATGVSAAEFDTSGRYLEATVGGLRVASLYLPSGSAGTAKQDDKYRFLDSFAPYLERRARLADEHGEHLLVCGDWNICHRRADLKNWRSNRTKSGFLPDERAFFDRLLGVELDGQSQVGDDTDAGRTGNPAGAPGEFYGAVDYAVTPAARERLAAGPATEPRWVDVVRSLHPEEDGPYSWWTYRGQAFDTNAGWRIDYHLATRQLASSASSAWVDRAEAYELRWSDHSPVLVTYDI